MDDVHLAGLHLRYNTWQQTNRIFLAVVQTQYAFALPVEQHLHALHGNFGRLSRLSAGLLTSVIVACRERTKEVNSGSTCSRGSEEKGPRREVLIERDVLAPPLGY